MDHDVPDEIPGEPLRGVAPPLLEWARGYDPDVRVPELDPAYYLDTQQAFVDNVRYRHTFEAWVSGARFSQPDNVEVRQLLG